VSETALELSQPLKECWNYLKIFLAILNTSENIRELR